MPSKKQQAEQNSTALAEQKQTKPKQKRQPRPEQSGITNPGDNTKYINHSMRIASLPSINMNDPEQVGRRITEYFTICAEEDMKPSTAGLALALNLDRRRLWEIRENVATRGVTNNEVRDLLKKAQHVLDMQMVDYMQNGKINPVSGIFLMKNNFGYTDKQEVVVTPHDPLGEQKDVNELKRLYDESMVPDA
jgi:hypothetical protein